MTVLRPKLSTAIGLVVAGALGTWFSHRMIALDLGLGWQATLGGAVGVALAISGIVMLATRDQRRITIAADGIELPAFAYVLPAVSGMDEARALLKRDFQGAQRMRVPGAEITGVTKHESVRGRLIQVSRRGAGPVFIQARFHCSLDEFLARCREAGLPGVEG